MRAAITAIRAWRAKVESTGFVILVANAVQKEVSRLLKGARVLAECRLEPTALDTANTTVGLVVAQGAERRVGVCTAV